MTRYLLTVVAASIGVAALVLAAGTAVLLLAVVVR